MSWKTPYGPEWWLRLLILFLVGGFLAACGMVATRTPPQTQQTVAKSPVAKPKMVAEPVVPPEEPSALPPRAGSVRVELAPAPPPPVRTESLDAWQERLEKYFQGSVSASLSEEMFTLKRHLSSTPLDPDMERILLATAGLFDLNRLAFSLQQQQPGSSLTPALQVALGDRYLAAGDVETARSLWQQATLAHHAVQTVTEAQRRLQIAATEGQSFRVGLLLPLSGRHAALGIYLLRAAQMALADFPDVPLELLVEDTAGITETALAGMERLAAQGVSILVGPVFLAPAKAVAEAARNRGIPIMPLNPHQDILQVGDPAQRAYQGAPSRGNPHPDVLLNAFLPEQQAEVIARFAVLDKGLRRFAILAPATPYGELTGKAFTQEILRQGGFVTHMAAFPDDSTDFTQWIKMLGNDFEAVFIPARADQVRLIAPQAANSGVGTPRVTFLGAALWNNPSLLLAEGTDYLNGSLFCDTDPLLRKQFETRYQQLWGNRPPALAQLVYDSLAILAQAQRDQRLGGPNWLQIVTRREGFYSSSGRVRFLKSGLGQREYHIFQVTPQGIQNLTPQPAAPPVLPLPAQERPGSVQSLDAPGIGSAPEMAPGVPNPEPGAVAPARQPGAGAGAGAGADSAFPPQLPYAGPGVASPFRILPGSGAAPDSRTAPAFRTDPTPQVSPPGVQPWSSPEGSSPSPGSRLGVQPGVMPSPAYGPKVPVAPGTSILPSARSGTMLPPVHGPGVSSAPQTAPFAPPGGVPPIRMPDAYGTPAPMPPPDFEPGYAPSRGVAPNTDLDPDDDMDSEAGPGSPRPVPALPPGPGAASGPPSFALPSGAAARQVNPGSEMVRPPSGAPYPGVSSGVPYPGAGSGSATAHPYLGPGAVQPSPVRPYSGLGATGPSATRPGSPPVQPYHGPGVAEPAPGTPFPTTGSGRRPTPTSRPVDKALSPDSVDAY
ncbi:MAG: penicillin-binding protein activator [Magnetococcales bacterium]|nr:penicillin-binding protein activator [Magnetococcales bacterium]